MGKKGIIALKKNFKFAFLSLFILNSMPKDGELTKLMDWRHRGNCPTPQLIPATLRQPPPAEVSLDVVSFRGIRTMVS